MMVFRKIRSKAGRHIHNIRGWRTKRKILVFESDDWGSIRMPSKAVYIKLLEKGIRVDECPFAKYDSLASEEDLTALFTILDKYKDHEGRNPSFTINTVVANPDFAKIRKSNYMEYHYEPFVETLKKYPRHGNSFSLWKQGIKAGLLFPQLHGREHLNVNRWMNSLRDHSMESRFCFDHDMFGISTTICSEKRESFMAAFDMDHETELKGQKVIIDEAQNIFRQYFDKKSESFIFSNYIWSPKIEEHLFLSGIQYIQGSRRQIMPIAERPKKNILHHLGERNIYGQYYLVRNAFFEPSSNPGNDVVSACLKQIAAAFTWNKPAVVGTHRLNFIGYIEENNRNTSLQKLDVLLSCILSKWPDVEFLNSASLGELLSNRKE